LARIERARRLALEPELTMTACSTPRYSANMASNCCTLTPMVTWVERRLSNASQTSSQPKAGTMRGMRV